MTVQDVGPLMTIPETCDYLRTGKTMLFEMLADGELSSLKIRGSRRIPKRAVERYLAARLMEEGHHDQNLSTRLREVGSLPND